MSAPSEARRREEARIYANRAVDACFRTGGDPAAAVYYGSIYFTCVYENGNVFEWNIEYDEYE